MRKCRWKGCRAQLPPLKEADGWPRAGYCDGICKRAHDDEKAATRKPMARKAPAKKRSRPKKQHGWRSSEYLAWVRTLPCCVCAGPGGDAHHIIGVGAGLSGMGMTAPDQYVMPLCRTCHDRMHRDTDLQKMQWEFVGRTLAKAVEVGPLEVYPVAA